MGSLFCLLFCTLAFAEVIDRIVAVVDGQIITLSDLRQEREMRALFGDKPIDDDLTLARQLVDNRLIDQQIADYPNVDVTDAEIDADLQKLNLSRTSNDTREAVRRRIRAQKFFDVKFRQSIRPTDDEVRKYYEDVFVPAARARGMDTVPPLTDRAMADAIRDNVIQENLDHEVEVWLEAIRRRSKIEVFQ